MINEKSRYSLLVSKSPKILSEKKDTITEPDNTKNISRMVEAAASVFEILRIFSDKNTLLKYCQTVPGIYLEVLEIIQTDNTLDKGTLILRYFKTTNQQKAPSGYIIKKKGRAISKYDIFIS